LPNFEVPPLKWSILSYFVTKEDCYGKEAYG
jgi:hypothetical protein